MGINPQYVDGLEARIDYFKAEIARLSNELVDVMGERDVLTAQVELLEHDLSCYQLLYKNQSETIGGYQNQVEQLRKIISVVHKEIPRGVFNIDLLYEDILEAMNVLNKSPSQCLAERDAEVAKAAFIAGAESQYCMGTYVDLNVAAEHHANQLHQAAK